MINEASAIRAVLSASQKQTLRDALKGRLVVACFGSGVDSTAMLVALRSAGIRPDVISFGDTNGEKRLSMTHLAATDDVLKRWGWPAIAKCRKITLPSTGYTDLYGNCIKNETLPSLAFGMSSCSQKFKAAPQDQYLKGATRGPNARPPHPVWVEAKRSGQRIVKLIGYDCGKADLRRAAAASRSDADFDYVYPLQLIGWSRPDCVHAIASTLGAHMVPIKSACFFCPASKQWELYWLAANDPDQLELALVMERRALTGKHSRFDSVEFGATWEELVRDADSFPSSKTTVGLGRSFAWNQWARVNGVVDESFRVLRGMEHRDRFMALANALRTPDNALDSRSSAGPSKSSTTTRTVIPLRVAA